MASQISVFVIYFIVCMPQMSICAIEFIEPPEPTAVELGSDLTLSCDAVDTPEYRPLSYFWEFDGSPVYTALAKASMSANNGLFVPRMTEQDLGQYTCVVQVTGLQLTQVRSHATVVKAYIEDFFMDPTDLTLEEGDKAMLECVTGYSAPPADVLWKKDGVTYESGTQQIGRFGQERDGGATQRTMGLEFTATADYEGSYTCIASNPLTGQEVSSAEAKVKVNRVEKSPSVDTKVRSMISAASHPLWLDCVATGWPLPTITWYKDSELITTDTSIKVLPNGTLYFQELHTSDQGNYTCSAVNKLGSADSLPLALTVAYLEVAFQSMPLSKFPMAGTTLTLTCRPPLSYPAPSVVWYKNNLPLVERSGDFAVQVTEDGDLYFSSVQLQDEGQYICVAINEYARPTSRTSPPAKVTVLSSPSLIQPPVAQRLIKGDLLTLNCSVQGNPFPAITWYHDFNLIIPTGRITIRSSKQLLLVSGVSKLDEGPYWCNASNIHGTISSPPVQVFVVVPPEILEPVQPVTTQEGSTGLMKCGVYGDPQPTVRWYKGDVLIRYDTRVSSDARGLQITSVAKSDEGIYRCEANNEGGTKNSEAFLAVQVPAKLTTWPSDRTVKAGEYVIFMCDASGDPQPTIIWTFNEGQALPSGTRIGSSDGTLLFDSAKASHSGIYTCTAQNALGQVAKSAQLFVQVKPSISNISGDAVVNQGLDLDLTCNVEGIPRPAISWYRNGEQLTLTPDNRVIFPAWNSLRIKFMTSSESGAYRCVAENPAGSAASTVPIYVRETPLPPVLSSAHAMSTKSVNITWIPAVQDPNNRITSFVIDYKQRLALVFDTYRDDIPSHLTSYEVGGLSPFTQYVFRVAAKNQVGTGAYSAIVGATTLETAPSSPRNLQMVSQKATSVVLRWEVPAQTNGDIRTYQVHFRQKFSNQEFSIQEIDIPTLPLQTFSVTGLTPYTTYEFKVRGATIEAGNVMWGSFSYLIDATTSGTAPSQAPGDVQLTALSSYSIHTSWMPVPEKFRHGPLLGYRISYKWVSFNGPYTQITVEPKVNKVNITGLLPWRVYGVKVTAYNVIGEGPYSLLQTVNTLPMAPSGSPKDVKVAVLSSSAFLVSWQYVPYDHRQSDISGYVVLYRSTDQPADQGARSRYIGNPDILTANISGLPAYTEYEVQVQAFTTQVISGYGPYSDKVIVTTLEDVPGPVRNVTVIPLSYGVFLSWLPPLQPNGIIRKYLVSYTSVVESDQPVRRDVVQADSKSGDNVIETSDTNVTVTGLHPSTRYQFTVVAETSVGRGPVPDSPASVETLQATTLSSIATTPPTPSKHPETSTEEATSMSPDDLTTAAPPSGGKDESLSTILGVTAAVVVLLAIIVALLLYICCRNRNTKEKAIYFIPPQAFTQQSIAELQGNTTDSTTDTGSPGTNNTYPSTDEDSGQYSATSPQHSSTSNGATGNTNDQSVSVARRSGNVVPQKEIERSYIDDWASSSMNELHLAHIPENHLQQRSRPYIVPDTGGGLINPSYELHSQGRSSNPMTSTSRNGSYTAPYTSQQELYTHNHAAKNRKNRMKSNTAAAIAAQKNRTTSVFDDTDMLIDDDAVVVYDERTAL